MANNTPLPLFWNELIPVHIADDPPIIEEIVVDASDLTDYELQEKINRISKTITSGIAQTLPDGGYKLRSTLRQLSHELDRRCLVRIQKGVGEIKYEKPTDTTTLIESYSQGEEDDKTGVAFGEELRLVGYANHRSLKEDGLQSQDEAHISSRDLSHSVSNNRRERKNSPNNKSTDIGASNLYSSHAGKALSRRVSKRRRVSNQGSTNLELEEVQHVVLLDDDAQPINSIQGGDASDDWKEDKLYYPSRDDPECVEITYSDLKCLDPESFLSSPVMNFFIQQLQRSDSMVARKEEFYVFNTYFYNKLEEAMTCKDDRTSTFLKLRRWWKGVDIFRKAYILLPIHGDMHWSLVIVCIPAKEDESSLLILHLDSLGVHASNQIFSVVSSYLKAEHKYINENEPSSDPPVSQRLWKFLPRRIEKEKITVPQQKNDYDCGLFVLFFMKQFIVQAPKRLRKKELSMFGRKWFDPADASGLRKTIQEDLIKLFKTSQLENAVEESHASPNTADVKEECDPN